MKHIHGLVAAAFTPMDEDMELDLARVEPMVAYLLERPVAGLFVCGSTGESPSLSVAERMQVAERYTEVSAGRLPCILHVGHNSLADARDLARHAAELQPHAIAMTPPCYFPIHSVGEVVDCLAYVAEAAPQTPLFYYHIPRLTAVSIDVLELIEACADQVPSLAGIKYSEDSFARLRACVVAHGERLNFLFGCDEQLLAGLQAGVHGAVGSTYNFMAPWYAEIIRCHAAGEIERASALQVKVREMVEAIIARPAQSALKQAMQLRGVDCGPPRLPLPRLIAEQVEGLRAELDELGFFAEPGL